jgi:hypothetical protein
MLSPFIVRLILRTVLAYILGDVVSHLIFSHLPPRHMAAIFWSQPLPEDNNLPARFLIVPAYSSLEDVRGR